MLHARERFLTDYALAARVAPNSQKIFLSSGFKASPMKFFTNTIIALIAVCLPLVSVAQFDTVAIKQSIQTFQSELNHEYRDTETSPLTPEKLKRFKSLPFYAINLNYAIQAKLIVTPESPFFKMKTSSNQVRDYRQYGILTFTLSGKEFKLPVYQSQQLMKTEEYADYLFLPFTDLTNGKETYTAGRYIDLRMPTDSDFVLLDFNKAYNPLCAYSNRYSCPVVPKENHLAIEIPAGVQYKKADE